MGSLFKQIYRYTHSREFRHNENLWPHITITRAPEGHIAAISYKKKNIKIEDLSKLKGTLNVPLSIIATGPSVKDLTLSKLSGMSTLGVNGAYTLMGSINFDYYVIVDRGFVEKKPELVLAILANKGLILFTTVLCLNEMLKFVTVENISCRLAIVEDIRYRIFDKSIPSNKCADFFSGCNEFLFDSKNKHIGYSKDIRKGIVDAGTVTYWALQIAFYLGGKDIFIAGLDMNNFSKPRFYEDEANKLPSFLEGNYETLIYPSFLYASGVMKDENCKVYNLSLNSALGDEVFKRISIDEV